MRAASRTFHGLALAAVFALPAGDAARAESEPSPAPRIEALRADCDPEDARRLEWIQRRLGEHAGYARWWWRGWTGVYVAGMAFEGVSAGLEDDRGKRANSIATAAKSAIGLGRALLSRPVAMQGSVDPSTSDAVSCHELLALAEERLREGADQAGDERWSWIPHAFNLGLNAAAAVVVAEMYDRDSAYWSGALGFAVGEVRIWSFPWHAARDWEAYQTRFRETARDPETTWRLEPTEDGARFVLRF